jgi:hypothetical protein
VIRLIFNTIAVPIHPDDPSSTAEETPMAYSTELEKKIDGMTGR